MTPLPITSITAGVLALIYLALTARVIQQRGKTGTSLGDGSTGLIAPGEEHTAPLLVACRSHANFAEYVPIALILIGLNEIAGGSRWFVAALAAALVLGRVLHPMGMARKVPNPFRAGGTMLTLAVLGVAGIALLVRTLL